MFISNRVAFLAFAAALSSCGSGSSPQPGSAPPVSAPANVRSAARLDATRIVLLTSEGGTRTIHITRVADGFEEKTFGVAPEITSVETLSERGPLVLGFSGSNGAGAFQVWSLAGRQLATYPLAAGALDITRTIGNSFYVLIGNGAVRAAQRVQARPIRIVSHAVPLPARATHLRLCKYGRVPYLLSSGSSGKIVLTNPESGTTQSSEITADGADCVEGRSDLFALAYIVDPMQPVERDAPENHLLRVTLPSLLQAQVYPAPRDAVALIPIGKDRLVEVASSDRRSTLQILEVTRLKQEDSGQQ